MSFRHQVALNRTAMHSEFGKKGSFYSVHISTFGDIFLFLEFFLLRFILNFQSLADHLLFFLTGLFLPD